jgi:predicted transcriptional regulator
MAKKLSFRTKIIIIASFIALLVLAIFLIWWFQSRTKSEMKDDAMGQVLQLDAIMCQARRETVALLAIKYSLDEQVVDKMLQEYEQRHDLATKVKSNIEGEAPADPQSSVTVNLNYAETVALLSSQYLISPDRLAALLIDYRVLSSMEKSNPLEALLSSKAKQSIMKYSLKELVGGVKKLNQ